MTAVLLALGVVHTALTPVFARDTLEDAVWFSGSGLAVLFVGLLNLAARRGGGQGLWSMSAAAGTVASVWGLILVVAIPEPHAFLALVVLVATTVLSARQAVRR